MNPGSPSVVNARFIKPIDRDLLSEICSNHQMLLTLEEGTKVGGFGSAVLEYLNENNINIKLKIMGIPDKFIEHGPRDKLLKKLRLDSGSISNIIKEEINNEKI